MDGVVLLLVMGLVLGFGIGLAVKFFGAVVDPRLEKVEGMLPNANCGACGFAGCADFARALVALEAEPGKCPSCSSEAVEQICELLGVVAEEREPRVAVVRCGGDNTKAKQAGLYNGVADCKDAVLVAGGAKGCVHGCLGLATCARACPFGAIEITDDGIAVVHDELCTGCGKCVSVCPRGLIILVPASAPVHVYCNSPQKGAAKSKVCKASCIGCRKCVKASEEGQMEIDGFLASVNYDNPPTAAVCEVCPTKCLRPASAEAASPQPEEAREVANA